MIMSEFQPFDTDDCFDFGGSDFDFDRDFITENLACDPPAPNRAMGSSPNTSDGSAGAEQLADGSGSTNFPVSLHEIVSNDDYECVHWLPCGTLFTISDKDAFTRQVIPRFFDARGGTKFTSFTRRLKRWNFNRVSSGANIVSQRRIGLSGHDHLSHQGKGSKKGSPSTIVKSMVKARRRASTGCMVDPDKLTDFECTPIPVKPSVQLSGSSALLELDSDMAEFLASPDFVQEEETIERLETVHEMPPAPPFSSKTLEPAPVTDCSLKETLQMAAQPTSAQSEKLHLSSIYQPKNTMMTQPSSTQSEKLHLSSTYIETSQLLLQNASVNMIQQMQPPTLPGVLLNVNQQILQRPQVQRPLFQPQMRRHSCMPMFGANNMDATSLFGASNRAMMGVYNNHLMPSASAFNPMMQVNNIHMNQTVGGQNLMMNMKSSEFPEQKAVAVPRHHEVTSKDVEQEDKWIDFDEYISRQDDD
ncbi:LOW QUALITY PROTEIN: hypothetical protein ACHAXN_002320 [Cyclotella atomus]